MITIQYSKNNGKERGICFIPFDNHVTVTNLVWKKHFLSKNYKSDLFFPQKNVFSKEKTFNEKIFMNKSNIFLKKLKERYI